MSTFVIFIANIVIAYSPNGPIAIQIAKPVAHEVFTTSYSTGISMFIIIIVNVVIAYSPAPAV
jgi:cbb3-type cytochrome oxidase subunit 3